MTLNKKTMCAQIIDIQETQNYKGRSTIKVIGIGGGGNNAVSSMFEEKLDGIEYISVNTDGPVLENRLADTKIMIGKETTRGQGAGMEPALAKKGAEEDKAELEEHIKGSDIIFLTAGLGGGTGTGATPIVADIAREEGILTIAVVTLPFSFEGTQRMDIAKKGLEEIKKNVDCYVVIQNEKLFKTDEDPTTQEAFKLVDDILRRTIHGIAYIAYEVGQINCDIQDLRKTMGNGHRAIIGMAEAKGKERGIAAVKKVFENELIQDVPIWNSRKMLISIIADDNFTIKALRNAVEELRKKACPDVQVIFGLYYKKQLKDQVEVVLICTDFETKPNENEPTELQYQGRKKNHDLDEVNLVDGANSADEPYMIAAGNDSGVTPVIDEIELDKNIDVTDPNAPSYIRRKDFFDRK